MTYSRRTGFPKKQVHLAAGFPGVNHWTVWSDPRSGSQTDFASFVHLAETAERGKFDFFFLAEGLRLREHLGRLHDLDVAGRPNTLTVLAALAAVTERIGLVGTLSSTFNEPYDLARQLATVDHLSDGRAGWNVVTSSDAFHGANFRRGGYLDKADRYTRAAEFVAASRRLWDSWSADALVGDQPTGAFLSDPDIGRYTFGGEHFDIAGRFTVPRSPQGHPVLVQAGDSAEGRDFAARTVDVVFSAHAELEPARSFYADVTRRVVAAGRNPDSVLVLPGAGFVLGDSTSDARDRAREVALAQVGPETARAQLEQVWGAELPDLDPDGPVPAPPTSHDTTIRLGQARHAIDPLAQARRWYDRATTEGLTVRELVIAETTRHTFVGTAAEVAGQIDHAVQTEAADGYILSGHITPTGLDEFVDTVVPELQDRGVFRTEYEGTTLRDHLGLGAPTATTLPTDRTAVSRPTVVGATA
ncbi:LLM class flavin-dependent oxidoreductase [Nakamurella silvestris]|nr:LLM class flavin-dependent oxidoreductase [Nakamurella silvestris]